MSSDQVGVDAEIGKPPRPWDRPRWLRSRGKELIYSLLSWPYILAFAMTWVFVIDPKNALALQAMLGAWTIAFVRREWANWMAQRK